MGTDGTGEWGAGERGNRGNGEQERARRTANGEQRTAKGLPATSVRVYFTNLCASVATKVNPSVENWKNTPLITGRRSSFPLAKIVLLMAVAKISPCKTVEDGSFSSMVLGNSSPGA